MQYNIGIHITENMHISYYFIVRTNPGPVFLSKRSIDINKMNHAYIINIMRISIT
ncbi:hypothetical protein GCM10023142_13980 [Anaerocolumna aminovalerica]